MVATTSFGYDGDGGLGDRLLGAVLRGEKTATSSLADAAEWRRAHEVFWGETIEMIRADSGDPTWELRHSEPVVVEWFHLLDDQGPSTE